MSATGPQRGARFTAVMAAVAARLPFGMTGSCPRGWPVSR